MIHCVDGPTKPECLGALGETSIMLTGVRLRSGRSTEQDALRESTLKGAKRILPAAYRALKGPVYLPPRGKTRERAWKAEAEAASLTLTECDCADVRTAV
jgi:hypothetical protein